MTGSGPAYRVLVIGGGVVGLATVEHLTRRVSDASRVALVEQHSLGHELGGSHGHSRITRSTYIDADYVRMITHAHAEEWPRLEHDAGVRLLHRVPGCFFGPPGRTLEAYRAAVSAAPGAVDELSPADGRKRFPAFAFPDAEVVLADGTAALVAAADTLRALEKLVRGRRAAIHENTSVTGIDTSGDEIVVTTSRGEMRAERVVVAAGSWTGGLLPALGRPIRAVHQSVGFFALDTPAAAHRMPEFPVWAYLSGETLGYYGLPEFGRPGIKAGRHEAHGDEDPDATPTDEQVHAELSRTRTFLDEQLAFPVRELIHTETCLYASTDDEDFVLDTLPGDPRVVVASGLSGHGFKFAPLIGRLAAELAIAGVTSVPSFERARDRFAIAPASR